MNRHFLPLWYEPAPTAKSGQVYPDARPSGGFFIKEKSPRTSFKWALLLELRSQKGTEIGADTGLRRAAAKCAMAVLLAAVVSPAQVITVDTSGKGRVAGTGQVDRQYAQVPPTHVELTKTELDEKTRLLLIRALQSEQGFAMRPLPRGHKGLNLVANGKLEPAGTDYLNMVISEGLCAKPGARVVITDIKIERERIVFDLDGGPDAKHRFLSHVQIGMGGPGMGGGPDPGTGNPDPGMGDPNVDPTNAKKANEPTGARLTLTFADHVPELTPEQIKALIAPLISFDVKSPIQAFTDTLPPALKDAIVSHKVLVGMTTEMVLFAKGQPPTKSREMDGQMPFEEWIYGTPPQEVDFVRINGNRVIRLEVSKEGEPLQIFTKDEVSGMMRTDGSPVQTAQTRTIQEGDVQPDTDRQSPAAPPTLKMPGEKLPTDNTTTGVMRPVQFPKPHPDETPGANPDEQSAQTSTPPASSQPAQPANGQQPSPTNASPANGSQAAPAKTQTPPAPSPSQPAATSSASQSATQPSASPSN